MAEQSEFADILRQISNIYTEICTRLSNIADLEREIEARAATQHKRIASLHRRNKEDLKRARQLQAECAEQAVRLLNNG